MISSEQYHSLVAQAYNRIPISKKVLADLETPLSTYLKLADGEYSYLFESVQGGEKWGRYSIIGLPAGTIIRVYRQQVQIIQDGGIVKTLDVADPFAWIKQYQKQFCVPEMQDLPIFSGGLVGYFSYDCVRYVESRLARYCLPDPLATPDMVLMLSDEVVIFDNLRGQFYIVVYANSIQECAYERAVERIQQLENCIKQPQLKELPLPVLQQPTEFTSNIAFAEYSEKVKRIKQYLVDGDAMQVVFSRRLTGNYYAHPLHLYRALRYLNPSPYLFYLNLSDHYIVGSSPEILVRIEQNEVILRPIAGTRPRGQTDEEDKLLEQDLLSDPKELAEHLMLIDLGRNDVGRIAEIGSVRVTEKMVIERYSHVMHIVSHVVGKLPQHLTAIDVLKATLPAGTLSGAPKVRAMEIIDEMETVKRGIYGGAVGYIAWNGNMDLAIAIRTAVIKDQQIAIQVGGGIVVDSNIAGEWQETINKSRALIKAVQMVENGLFI
jgi:anthranilate synthase component I